MITILTALTTLDLLVTILVWKHLKNQVPASRDESMPIQNDQDIHSILNYRLLDIQNRRYSVPQKRDKHE